jgi:hypothetical protein
VHLVLGAQLGEGARLAKARFLPWPSGALGKVGSAANGELSE